MGTEGGEPRAGGSPLPHLHPTLPIRARFPVDLDPADLARVRGRAREILDADPELRAGVSGLHTIRSGIGAGPGLVIHDIARLRPAGHESPSVLEYRGLLLAGDDDVVVIGVPRSPAFEDHVRTLIGLRGAPVHSVGRVPGGHLAEAILRDTSLLDRLAHRAREAGSFGLRPYVSTPEVWELAREIGVRADVPVRVEAPPPVLARRVNNKLWFTEQARAVLGAGSTPPTAPAADLHQLARRLEELGGPGDKVAVRLRSTSAGEGNLVIPKSAVSGSRPEALELLIDSRFGALEKEDIFPLQVAVWEAPVVASPSVQTWVPLSGQGPVVEGIMEQAFAGPGLTFSGATPAALPADIQRSLAREAALLASLFQELGWLGRCSFDAILVQDGGGAPIIHWVECNGRWGGASIPMTVAERLVGDWRRHPFAVLGLPLRTPRLPARQALDRLDRLLLRSGGDVGVLLLSPTSLELGQGLDLMAIADTRDRARELTLIARERLLGNVA